MAGPVWRFEASLRQSCAVCFRETTGVFVEGEVHDNGFVPSHAVCPDCYGRTNRMVVSGEAGSHVSAPAYARKP